MPANPDKPIQFGMRAIFLLVVAAAIPLAAWRAMEFVGLLLVWIAVYVVATTMIVRSNNGRHEALSSARLRGAARRVRWLRLGVLQMGAGLSLALGTTAYIEQYYPGDAGALPPPSFGFCCLSVPMVVLGIILLIMFCVK